MNTIEVRSNNSFVPELIQSILGIPSYLNQRKNQAAEPLNPIDAALWKVVPDEQEAPRFEAIVYGSDIVWRENFSGIDVGKPSRSNEKTICVLGKDIPESIYSRYCENEVVQGCWRFAAAMEFGGVVSICELFVKVEFPKISQEDLVEYYSEHSSAGLLLVKYLKEKVTGLKYEILDSQFNNLGEIDDHTAWNLIVNKVVPKTILLGMLAKVQEKPCFLPFDARLALSKLYFLQSSNSNNLETNARDGSKIFISWLTETDCESVSAMLFNNFDTASTYSDLTENARYAYKNANSAEKLRQDSQRESVALALVVKDVNGEILGFIRVDNGHSKASNGSKALVIKRFHVNLLEQKGNKKIGSILLQFVEEYAKFVGIETIGIGSSGSSSIAFERMGFETISFTGNEKAAGAPYVWMEKTVTKL